MHILLTWIVLLFAFQVEVQAYLSTHTITSQGTNIPNPILSFDEANYPGNL